MLNAEKEDGLVSRAMRHPSDQSPEDGTVPGLSLGMHSLIPMDPVPRAQLLEQEKPLIKPNGMALKLTNSHCIYPSPEQPLTARVIAFILSPVAQGVYILPTVNSHPCRYHCKGCPLGSVLPPIHPSWFRSQVTSTGKPLVHVTPHCLSLSLNSSGPWQ